MVIYLHGCEVGQGRGIPAQSGLGRRRLPGLLRVAPEALQQRCRLGQGYRVAAAIHPMTMALVVAWT